MNRSRSRSNLDKQIETWSEQLRQKTPEGYDIIKNKDRPSKLKTFYQQIQEIDNQFQQQLDKQSSLNSHRTEQQRLCNKLNAVCLSYIQQQKSKLIQQSSSVLQKNEGEAPADESEPVKQNHCLSGGKGNENEDSG